MCNSSNTNHTATPGAFEGIRICDVSDPRNPSLSKGVQTDCGSHTHTLVPDLANGRVLIYVSSYALSAGSLGPDCQGAQQDLDRRRPAGESGRGLGDRRAGPRPGHAAVRRQRVPARSRLADDHRLPRHHRVHGARGRGGVLPLRGYFIPTRKHYTLVGAWYAAGTSVVSFDDPASPKEVGWYKPMNRTVPPGPPTFYNGEIYSNDIDRGFDVFRLTGRSRSGVGAGLPFDNPQTQMNVID